MLIVLLCSLIVSAFCLYMLYVENLITTKSREERTLEFFFCLMPTFNLIVFCYFFLASESKVLLKRKELNEAKKCLNCQVSSRNWQIQTVDEKEICPVCEKNLVHFELMDVNIRYPYAKKLTLLTATIHMINTNKDKKKERQKEKREEKIAEKRRVLTLYHAEIEAYENFQASKHKCYQKGKKNKRMFLNKQG